MTEVPLGPPGSPPRLHRAVPPDLLTEPTFRSGRGERHLEHIVGGEPTRSHGVQGIYRPAPESAAAMGSAPESAAAMAALVAG
ncbi:hypothetical protein [Streptomyces sp. NPDC005322]|uniref:hypothetical protein n=1 Tax=Streptomyces sp. NPDC005322 TaxID=3157032 RepID=UPI0033A66D2D